MESTNTNQEDESDSTQIKPTPEQSQTTDPDIIRTKICLTDHHNDLLDHIAEKQYASRSEAARAAIQHHSRYLSESDNTDIESLQKEIKQLTKEIDQIHKQIEEQNSDVVHIAEKSFGNTENVSSGIDSETENKIVKELTKSHPLSVNEIVERIGEDVVSVIPKIKSLQQEGIISPVSENTDKYKIDI
jgi:predicted transcriptional regulator